MGSFSLCKFPWRQKWPRISKTPKTGRSGHFRCESFARLLNRLPPFLLAQTLLLLLLSERICLSLPVLSCGFCRGPELSGALLNRTWSYNSHETTTYECSNSTSWGLKAVTAVKWRLLDLAIIERQQWHSQRPPNYNNSEPTAVKWQVRNSTIAAEGTWDFKSLPSAFRRIPEYSERERKMMSWGRDRCSHPPSKTHWKTASKDCSENLLRSTTGNLQLLLWLWLLLFRVPLGSLWLRSARQNRKSRSQRFSFARVKSQGNSAERLARSSSNASQDGKTWGKKKAALMLWKKGSGALQTEENLKPPSTKRTLP